MSYSNTDTPHADPYKEKNVDEPGSEAKIDELVRFVGKTKFCMMTTQVPGKDLLVSRAMALAAQENGVDLIFHSNTESGKTDDLEKNNKVNVAFINSSGEWASVSGDAQISIDKDDKHKYYDQSLKAWIGDLGDGKHDGGPDDPRICIVRIKPSQAQYATSGKTMIGSAIQVAKGIVTGEAAEVNNLRYIGEDEINAYRSSH